MEMLAQAHGSHSSHAVGASLIFKIAIDGYRVSDIASAMMLIASLGWANIPTALLRHSLAA